MYLLVNNGVPEKYPYSIGMLRKDNPQVSFPANPSVKLLEEYGVFPVVQTQPPVINRIRENLKEETPQLVDGSWVQTWTVVPASDEEIQARQLEVKQEITSAVQDRLDTFARTRGYDNIVSACSYATSTHPKYGPEGRYCVQSREDTWDVLFAIETEVLQGIRPMPMRYEDIAADLPVLAWPGDAES